MADQPVTREKLINADIDVDNLGKAMNEKGVVNPRYGDSYPTLPSAIQEVIETGGFEPFATEALLLDSIPILDKKAAYALDTHKIFLWENGAWIDTGMSAIDRAKLYADQGLKEFVPDQTYIGPVQVVRHGVVWELPAGQTSNGSSIQSPAFDSRWIQKIFSETDVKLDKYFTPYVVYNGVQSTDLNKRYTHLVDRAIKRISLIGKDLDRFNHVQLKTFNIKVATTVSLNITIALLDSMSNSLTTKDIELTATVNKAADSQGFITVYSKADANQFEMVLDTKLFDYNIQYQISATLKENGLLNKGFIEFIENKYFEANVIGAANTYRGDAFALARALKDITLKGDFINREASFVSIEKQSTQFLIDFKVTCWGFNVENISN